MGCENELSEYMPFSESIFGLLYNKYYVVCNAPVLCVRINIFITCWCSVPVAAHRGRSWGWGSVTVQSRQLSRGLQNDTFHRVQRSPWDLPLLRKQVQLLADDYRPARPVLCPAAWDAESWQPTLARQPMPSLYQGCADYKLLKLMALE